MEATSKPGHIGRKISRLRELRGLKQDFLAIELGISQQAISKIEQSETIDELMLERIGKVLGVPAEGIKKFDEETVLNIISNTFTSNDTSTLNAVNIQPTFNTVDKIVELYERLLQTEREKIALLEKFLKER